MGVLYPRRSHIRFHVWYAPKNWRIFEMTRPFLMHRETAMGYLDMDEFTFEKFVVPAVTKLRFGSEVYFLTDQLESGVLSLIEGSMDGG
tara:strand:+ start:191 stop:457 length:267 start_codon:yes stop_codon:yes gene_type:complete